MKLRNFGLYAVILIFRTPSPALFAQKEFEDAHNRITMFFQKASVSTEDPTQRAAIVEEANQLPGVVTPLIVNGVLKELALDPSVSSDNLTMKIAQGLATPNHPMETLQDADGVVSVVRSQKSKTIAIAFDVITCASCTKSWVGVFDCRDGIWVVASHLADPPANDAVHLAQIDSKSEDLVLLCGIHWGDAHNRLDVKLYSVEDGKLLPVWSQIDLIQGTIGIHGNEIDLTSWTSFTQPCKEKRQAFRIVDHQPKLLKTSFAAVK